jgi:RNA polymerase sigma factor (sigma-70 family)
MTAPQLRDEELIRLFLSTRQNEYFETIYHRYMNKVYRRCYSLTKCTAKAEDYTQDIFLRVHANLNGFKERSSFSTWLYSISYNYCMDQIRLNHRLNTVTIDEDMAHNIADEGDADHHEEQLQTLQLAIQTISTDEITLLRLKYEDDLDIKEIAKQYNLKDSAVKMRLKRTRDKLRTQYTYRLEF